MLLSVNRYIITMKKYIQVGLVLVLMVGLVNCRKDSSCTDPTNPKCPNYNPCTAVHPLSAAFNIYEDDCTVGPGSDDTSWHYYPTDTLYSHCATFSITDSTVDSVRWNIGAGVYYSKSFTLNFNFIGPASVPITLTVYKHRNQCYPTDDTIKTLTKTIYFVDTCIALGTYYGYFDNNTADTGTISIKKVTGIINTPYGIAFGYLSGFATGCTDTLTSPAYWETFYTSVSFRATGSTGFCKWVKGSLFYNRFNNTVLIQYQDYNGYSSVSRARNFNGIKIN